jgi:hypothetical protein
VTKCSTSFLWAAFVWRETSFGQSGRSTYMIDPFRVRKLTLGAVIRQKSPRCQTITNNELRHLPRSVCVYHLSQMVWTLERIFYTCTH